jgi:hypothetical protein
MQSQVLECLTSHLHFKLIIQNNENSGMWRSQKPVTWAIHVITRSWQAVTLRNESFDVAETFS